MTGYSKEATSNPLVNFIIGQSSHPKAARILGLGVGGGVEVGVGRGVAVGLGRGVAVGALVAVGYCVEETVM